MGTWGPGIYSNDTAGDVRSAYREHLGDGLSGKEATNRVLSDLAEAAEDSADEDHVSFWLALAATQWSCGRLEKRVKDRALKIIKKGADLDVWREEAPRLLKKREEAIAKLKAQLQSPQRAPVKIRPTYHEWTDWEVGDAVGYRLLSGRWVIVRVVGIEVYRDKDRWPLVELCRWVGDTLPAGKAIQRLPVHLRESDNVGRGRVAHTFALTAFGKKDKPEDRLQLIARGLKVKRRGIEGTFFFGGWRHFDDYLQRHFGYR